MKLSKNGTGLLKGSFIYLLSTILNSALPFLLLPLLTIYLNPSEYGKLGIFQAIYTVFLALVGFSVSGAIVRKSYELGADEIGIYIGNCLLLLVLGFTFFFLIIFFAGDFLSIQMKIEKLWIYYSLIFAACMFVMNIALGQLQVKKRAIAYGLAQLGNGVLNIGLSLSFVILMSWGAEGRILGMLIAALVFAIGSFVYLVFSLGLVFQFQKKYITSALSFGVPLIPHELGTFFMTWFSMFVINRLLSLEAVGIYLFAFQLSMILGVTCDAFNRAFVPWLFEKLSCAEYGQRSAVVRLTYGYFVLMLFIALIAFIVGPFFITHFFDVKYVEGAKVIGLLTLGQAFGGMYLMVTNYIYFSNKTVVLAIITTTSSIIGVISLLFFIEKFGLIGASVSFVLARLSMFILTWVASMRLVPMPWFEIFGKKYGS